MVILIFILVYLVSLAIHLIICYRENKYFIHDVGDLIDLTKFYMWFPLLNTLVILAGAVMVIILIVIVGLWTLFRLDILWEKFRNIKLR